MDGIDSVAAKRAERKWRLALSTCVASILLALHSDPLGGLALLVGLLGLLGWIWWQLWRSGRSGRIVAAGIIAAVGALAVVTDIHSRAERARVEALRRSLELELGAALAVGDASEKIERTLQARAPGFTYHDNRYYASAPTVAPDCRIDIAIETDAQKRFLKSSVQTVYTSL